LQQRCGSKAAIRSDHDESETKPSRPCCLRLKEIMRTPEARMDERDLELLDKQMRCSQAPPAGNPAVAAFGAALFVSGLVLGSLLLGPADRMQYAAAYGTRIAPQRTTNGLN
jgi:hypothetical protein